MTATSMTTRTVVFPASTFASNLGLAAYADFMNQLKTLGAVGIFKKTGDDGSLQIDFNLTSTNDTTLLASINGTTGYAARLGLATLPTWATTQSYGH